MTKSGAGRAYDQIADYFIAVEGFPGGQSNYLMMSPGEDRMPIFRHWHSPDALVE
ncbi:hypothetical protein [Pseudoxanthomonas wuyuanensis]